MTSPRKESESDALFRELARLLDQIDSDPAPPKRRGPGRPPKHRAVTSPVIVHLYTSQVRWLDEYARRIELMRPDNKKLSRAEIIRGLLLGLGRFAIESELQLSKERPIQSERDLQHALANALKAKPEP